mmetsp:Transcript_19371/g.53995  ORF Transcript_19371/g.53995 Transcript_19371/m.53995 type:complete len:84 (+) Transcript_19371:945-1196(+)
MDSKSPNRGFIPSSTRSSHLAPVSFVATTGCLCHKGMGNTSIHRALSVQGQNSSSSPLFYSESGCNLSPFEYSEIPPLAWAAA